VRGALAQLGPRGYFPLLARLYLPAGWLKENAESAEKGVPEEHRRFTPKGEIALALLDAVRGAGETARPVVAEAGYAGDKAFADGLRERGLAAAETGEEKVGRANERAGWLKAVLGLDHFEGRTWHGWHHHASLVFAAYDLLAAERRGVDLPPFSSLPR
jgi:SRSO17 transposase